MSTILTDDERPKLPMPRVIRGANPHVYSDLDMEAYADAREAAVLAKLARQEPVAWQWLNTANFRMRLPASANKTDWNPLYTHPAPQQTDRQVPDGVLTAISRAGFSLVKSANAYELMRLGKVEAERQARQAAQIENEALKARIARADVELQRAVIAEREACAKVCEGRIGGAVQSNDWWAGFKTAMKQCAAAIRARGAA